MSTAVTKNSQNCLSQQSVILSVKCYWSLKIILTTLLTSLPGNLSALRQKIVLQSCTCLYIWFCYQDCYLLWFVGHVTGRDVIVVVIKRWHTDETCIIIIIIIIIITTSRLQHNSNLLHSQQCITHTVVLQRIYFGLKMCKIWHRLQHQSDFEPPAFENTARYLNAETSLVKLGPCTPENLLSVVPHP